MDQVSRRKYIEKTFASLESFWTFDVPEAVVHEDWSELDLLDFVEEARGIPFVYYDRLIREIGEDMKAEYADRLAKLDALIVQNKPALMRLLKSG